MSFSMMACGGDRERKRKNAHFLNGYCLWFVQQGKVILSIFMRRNNNAFKMERVPQSAKNLYAYLHSPWTLTIWWWRPRMEQGMGGLEKVNGGKKRDVCNTFNKKEFFLRWKRKGGRHLGYNDIELLK